MRAKTIVWLLVLVLCVPGLASAVKKSRLIGKVVDPEGNPIEGATLSMVHTDYGIKHTFTTNSKGKIVHRGLTVGLYDVTIEKEGYQGLKSQFRARLGTPPAADDNNQIPQLRHFVRAVRGQFRLILRKPESTVLLTTRDVTLPDVREGRPLAASGGSHHHGSPFDPSDRPSHDLDRAVGGVIVHHDDLEVDAS